MFHFYTPPADFSLSRPSPRVARVRANMDSTRKLLASLGKGLRFPPHYGKNFDAFWDCIRDLDIAEHRVIILHSDLPAINADDLEVYLGILRDAAIYWEKHAEEHSLESWFPDTARSGVESVLARIPPADPDFID